MNGSIIKTLLQTDFLLIHSLINQLIVSALFKNKEAYILNWRRNIPMFMLRLESNREICEEAKDTITWRKSAGNLTIFIHG